MASLSPRSSDMGARLETMSYHAPTAHPHLWWPYLNRFDSTGQTTLQLTWVALGCYLIGPCCAPHGQNQSSAAQLHFLNNLDSFSCSISCGLVGHNNDLWLLVTGAWGGHLACKQWEAFHSFIRGNCVFPEIVWGLQLLYLLGCVITAVVLYSIILIGFQWMLQYVQRRCSIEQAKIIAYKLHKFPYPLSRVNTTIHRYDSITSYRANVPSYIVKINYWLSLFNTDKCQWCDHVSKPSTLPTRELPK